MSGMITKKCKTCGTSFSARLADHNRGWAKFCSKSCKAKKQEQLTGHFKKMEKFTYYQREYGGIPNFDRNGDYTGFQCTGFSNEE